jgi:hypothetical protein
VHGGLYDRYPVKVGPPFLSLTLYAANSNKDPHALRLEIAQRRKPNPLSENRHVARYPHSAIEQYCHFLLQGQDRLDYVNSLKGKLTAS